MSVIPAAHAVEREPSPTASCAGSGQWLEPLVSGAVIIRFGRDAQIVAQDEPSDYCFQVVSGCVRTAMELEDGRRQIGEFLFPGDIVGYNTDGGYPFSAAAVSEVTLRRFHLAAIEMHAMRDARFAQALRHYTAAQLHKARLRHVLLGRATAGERISYFIREMRGHMLTSATGQSEMPMKLMDVADYLGLALETVCRGMAASRRAGAAPVPDAMRLPL